MEWQYYDSTNTQVCEIMIFDDGNQDLQSLYYNNWIIIADNNKGKYKLKNYFNHSIIINSISSWKIKIL